MELLNQIFPADFYDSDSIFYHSSLKLLSNDITKIPIFISVFAIKLSYC
jgi:hypothetical protein